MSPSRAERKAMTRAAILATARRRFSECGYEATTIRDIAASAGVSVGSVHVHFRDKRALLFACFFAKIAEAVERVWETMPRDEDLLDQLTHCGYVLYRAYADHPELSRVMFRETLFPQAQAEQDQQFEPFLRGIADLFVRARDRGELTRLPEEGRRAAYCFFASYLLVLIGGLSGTMGSFDEPQEAATAWSSQLRSLLQLQLEGLGAHYDER